MHDQLGGRTMLRDLAGGRISADERVGQTADARVLDEYPHRRDPEREPVHDNIDRPQWCPAGLTRSQKRRVQRLRQTEALEEEREEVLTPFFGTRQKDDEWKECEVENGNGARRKGIGHGLVPIRCLSVYGQVLIRDGLGLEGSVFIY